MNTRVALISVASIAVALIIAFLIWSVFFNRSNNIELPEIESLYDSVNDSSTVILTFNDINIELEVAKSREKTLAGLMGRTGLEENKGMIFVFPNEQDLIFWMKDTLIPLDIIYLDEDYKVVTIHKDTKINQTQEMYYAYEPARYTVELLGGWTEKNGLEVGDEFEVKEIINPDDGAN